MDNIKKIREALEADTALTEKFIASLHYFEKLAGYPKNNVRDSVTGLLADQVFSGRRFSKSLSNGLHINFVYNSRIAREFLMSQPTVPDHVWEPQTTKLLLHFSKGAKNVVIAGAYFGDHAIPVANNIRDTGTVHAFEPNKGNSDLIIENAGINGLKNIVVNNLALWNKSGETLVFEGEDDLASTVVATAPSSRGLHTITIDDYLGSKKPGTVNLLMIDVEGSEIKVLEGARQMLTRDRPVVVFETHSLYNDWSKGLQNSDSATLMSALGYALFAVREFHLNIGTAGMPVELLPIDRTYCEIPPHHGFNLLAVPSQQLVENDLFRIVFDLSPKLLLHKNDKLFMPTTFNDPV